MSSKKVSIGLVLTTLSLFCISSCSEIRTGNAKEAYRYWSGSPPPEEVKVIHGQYWQSGHWSKEYVVYMELQAPSSWIRNFIEQNHLVRYTGKVALPSDIPGWFNPDGKVQIWKQKGFDEGSVYYEDSSAQRLYIYEIQL